MAFRHNLKTIAMKNQLKICIYLKQTIMVATYRINVRLKL